MAESRINGQRMRMARIIRGLSSPELGAQIGVSKQAIWQFEQGDSTPSPETMVSLCRVLRFPLAFFLEGGKDTVSVGASFCRTTNSAQRQEKDRQQQMNLLRGYLLGYFGKTVAFPPLQWPNFTLGDCADDMERFTLRVRAFYHLDDTPILSMTNFLENIGIVCGTYRCGDSLFDAISQQPVINGRSHRITAYNVENTTFARLQFTLAHELGHWLLGHLDTPLAQDEPPRLREKQANAFASALLLPAKVFSAQLYDPTDLRLYVALKQKWYVSIAMMIVRARDLRLLNAAQYQNLYRQLSRRNWRKQEPLDDRLAIPSPSLFPNAVETLHLHGIVPKERLAATLARQVFSAEQSLYEELLALPRHALDPQERPSVRLLVQ